MTTGEEAYAAWAPEDGRWSPWVKPVLFATAGVNTAPLPPLPDVPWAPPARAETAKDGSYREGATPAPGGPGTTAIVLDLPGRQALLTGIALAERGYRPIPVLASVPGPAGKKAAVDVGPMQTQLTSAAPRLRELALPADAPPVFILDEGRRGSGHLVEPGHFDNRSIVFAQDFPSAKHLRAAGIGRVLVVASGRVYDDVFHALCRWRDAGLVVEKQAPTGIEVTPFDAMAPASYRALAQRAFALLGFKRSPVGGFGVLVPERIESSGGGGGYRGGFG